LANPAPCLGIDLPGCGLSSFEPKSWDAYTTGALVELLAVVIERYRDSEAGQGIVLIGHSMGCSLAALLASTTSPHPSRLTDRTLGLVGICPRSSPLSQKEMVAIQRLLWVPNILFDLWRRWDRRGGIESASVARFMGKEADIETKKLQLKFNDQSKTAVWRRMVGGLLTKDGDGHFASGLPGKEVWSGLEIPVLLVAGEADNITKPEEVEKIAEFLGKSGADSRSGGIPDTAQPVSASSAESARQSSYGTAIKDGVAGIQHNSQYDEASTPRICPSPVIIPKPRKLLKRTILPAPASHSLIYSPSSCHILSGLISNFLAAHVDPRLSPGWQLQYLATGKWGVKNLIKWESIIPVSGVIGGIFRAMKTLREADERHNPKRFAEEWGPAGSGEARIGDVVDISHDNPVYDPHGLETGGVRYHKFPTVSKIPPMPSEVNDFITLIDGLLAERTSRSSQSSDSEKAIVHKSPEKDLVIGVHCHYGFNRTGFFICSYLIERRNYGVQQAIDEFAQERPPGIRHMHFIDELFVRYCVGLKRAPTL
jgi:pimeloyl-ACP methyl ester carboxylesterase